MTWTERTTPQSIPYDIEPQYERALHGLHPAYPLDVTTLAHDGWNPEWNQMWAERAANAATWQERTRPATVWTERT